MDKKKDRKSFFEEIQGPNEKRFENINYNINLLSKHSNNGVVDFKRYPIRDIHRE